MRREIGFFGPDGKSQVSVKYNKDGTVDGIDAVVISTQHEEQFSEKMDELREIVMNYVIKPVCGDLIDENTKIHINPTGKFVIGGPIGDAGLTGRKIIVDTYGGMGRHGGGAFSGKDSSKVDRSAAYMARYIAKNIVAAKLATRCEVQLSYAIGIAEPTSIYVDAEDGKLTDEEWEAVVRRVFPLTPKGIIDHLDLKKPCFRDTATYGHFGGDKYTWEQTDMAEKLRTVIDSPFLEHAVDNS
jgi:S-adenosylmethionine synthetase